MLKIERTLNRKRRVWKRFDYDKLVTHMRLLVFIFVFINHANIKFLTRELQDCINSVIHAIVFLIKSSSRTKSYWNQKCVVVVTTMKRCRREWTTIHIKNSWKTYLHAMNVKKKVIIKKKKLKFKKVFQILIDRTTSLWRLARWAKKKIISQKKFLKSQIWYKRNLMKQLSKWRLNLKTRSIYCSLSSSWTRNTQI